MLKMIYILPGALSMRRFLLLDIKQASIDKSCRQEAENRRRQRKPFFEHTHGALCGCVCVGEYVWVCMWVWVLVIHIFHTPFVFNNLTHTRTQELSAKLAQRCQAIFLAPYNCTYMYECMWMCVCIVHTE